MTRTRESDPVLRRFERNLVVACLGMAAVAALAGRPAVALGILGGGALMAFSYWAIKGGVDAIVGGSRRRTLALLARFAGRYALLALAAYVMLAYLHAHPVGLLLGAASPVIAVAVEAARFVRTSSRPGHSQ